MKQEIVNINEIKQRASQIFNNLDCSEGTRKDYVSRIGFFISYAQENGLNRNTYLSFKRYLETKSEYTVSTKNKYLATARVFLKELNRLGFLPVDITQNVKLFSQSKKHKREGFTEEEIMELLTQLESLPNRPNKARLRALFSLLAFQGLRQIEIIRLDRTDVDLVRKIAFVRGKGSDDKELIYLAPQTVSALREYMKTNKVGSGALFKSMGNRKSERISTMTIKRQLGALCKEVGIEKGTHGFRHFFITALLKKLDVRDVRKFSRHSSLEMLIVYDDEIDIKKKTVDVFQVFEKFNVA
jgi:integrase